MTFLMSFFIIIASVHASFKIPRDWVGYAGIIDHHIAAKLLPLRATTLAGQTRAIQASIDLEKTKCSVVLSEEGVCSNSSHLLVTWDELADIAEKKQGCFAIYDDGSKPWRVSALSKSTNIPASLCPPLTDSGAPTMVLGGFTMHRIVGDNMSPMVDTNAKISSVASSLFLGASVFDTCCGLGYTAIGAADRVGSNGKVITVEFDEASLEMCAYNPWSKGLFDATLPIDIIQGDSCEVCKGFADNSFNAIIHDPPARALCRNDLYGLNFYRDLRRVLKPSGTLFHYIGRSDSKESGRLYKGIQERLLEAGFLNVKKYDAAFGLVATGQRRGEESTSKTLLRKGKSGRLLGHRVSKAVLEIDEDIFDELDESG